MKLTLDFTGQEFHIKNEGRMIAAILDEEEAMRVFANLLDIRAQLEHSCPACEDGPEVDIIRRLSD